MSATWHPPPNPCHVIATINRSREGKWAVSEWLMTTALVANHSVRLTSLYELSDLIRADPNLAITFRVLTARLRPHLTWRSNMKILNLNGPDTPWPYSCAVCGHLRVVSGRCPSNGPIRGPYKVTYDQWEASMSRPWVSVCVGGCCVSGPDVVW